MTVTVLHNPSRGMSRNVLVYRPIVRTPEGTRLCRPREQLFDLL